MEEKCFFKEDINITSTHEGPSNLLIVWQLCLTILTKLS